MNRLQQILHILKKDIRQRWPEIAAVLALSVLLTIVSVDNPTQSGGLARVLSFYDIVQLVYVLLPVTWCVLIARAIHGESLPGREQLWLTRPYDRLSLVLAKLALVLLFVHLPLIVAHAVVLNLSDLAYTFGAMAIGHLVLFAVLTLPSMAVASLTRSLGQFIAVTVGILVAVVAVLYIQSELLYEAFGIRRDYRQEGWAVAALIYLFVAVCTAAACAWQYRTRHTRAVTKALASAAVMAVLMIFIDAPRKLARALELRLYDGDTAAPLVAFGPPEVIPNSTRGTLVLRIPQTGAGSGPDAPVLHDWRVRLITESGVQLEQHSMGHGDPVEIFLGRDWLARFGDSALQVKLDYVVETFDETARQQVQISHEVQAVAYIDASLIDGRLHCWFTAWDWTRAGGVSRSQPFTNCRSAFTSPRDWYFELVRTADGLTGMITHERSELQIVLDPIINVSLQWYAEEGTIDELFDISTLPVIVRKRATLERGQLELDDIVLTDLIASD